MDRSTDAFAPAAGLATYVIDSAPVLALDAVLGGVDVLPSHDMWPVGLRVQATHTLMPTFDPVSGALSWASMATFEGFGTPGDQIEVQLGDATLARTDVNAQGQWAIGLSQAQTVWLQGVNEVSVVVREADGDTHRHTLMRIGGEWLERLPVGPSAEPVAEIPPPVPEMPIALEPMEPEPLVHMPSLPEVLPQPMPELPFWLQPGFNECIMVFPEPQVIECLDVATPSLQWSLSEASIACLPML